MCAQQRCNGRFKAMGNARVSAALVVALSLLATFGCGDSPTAPSDAAQIAIEFLPPATARSVVVEVTGPRISPSVVVDAEVESGSTAVVPLTVPMGADRRITASVFDASGTETHRGDTTVVLLKGTNPALLLSLKPLPSTLGVTVTSSGVRLSVADTSRRLLDPGVARIDALGFDASGRRVAASALQWAVSDPAIVYVREGQVVGLNVGTTVVEVSYRGASVRVDVEVKSKADPLAVESRAATLYRLFHQSTQGSGEGLNGQSKMMSLESYAQVSNHGLSERTPIPRLGISNQGFTPVSLGNHANWVSLSALMRTSLQTLLGAEAYVARGATLESAARDNRARGFAWFNYGLALGTLAMGYDSVAMVTPRVTATQFPPFVSPQEAVAEALAALDTAVAIFSLGDVSAIPREWVGHTGQMSPVDFVRLVRSYKAKLRAGVARTPAERAAVNWAEVVADAAAGITGDHRISLELTTGWTSSLDAGVFQFSSAWHQMSLLYSGMADASGAYQAWSALPLASRVGMNLLVQTPDTRWPQGATRAAQVANSGLPLRPGRYFANRDPALDLPDNSNVWGTSQYDHRRWYEVAVLQVGTYAFMAYQEIAMLRAEGLIRTGSAAAAMDLVNASRTANGLSAFTDPLGVAPGGNACVPRLPNGDCGTLLEAMKYEKRMETQLTGYMQWFLDSRGWGDLVQGTALHWPVPYQEMQLRGRLPYDMPSAGTLPAAGVGTYGF